MSQYFNVYVKIITSEFEPMSLPVDHVWLIDGLLAQYLVKNGSVLVCNSAGTLITPPWPPLIQSSEIDGTTLLLNYDIGMAVTDETGITVDADGVDKPVLSATAAGSIVTVELTVGSGGVAAGQLVVIHYDDGTGNIVSDIGVPVKVLSNYPVTNNTV